MFQQRHGLKIIARDDAPKANRAILSTLGSDGEDPGSLDWYMAVCQNPGPGEHQNSW